jgi:hypothetical protein
MEKPFSKKPIRTLVDLDSNGSSEAIEAPLDGREKR